MLEWQEFEPDPPQYGEVAVKVEASGVLLADVLWQLGITPVGPKHPFIPGYDVVGVIEEVGSNVSGMEKGWLALEVSLEYISSIISRFSEDIVSEPSNFREHFSHSLGRKRTVKKAGSSAQTRAASSISSRIRNQNRY